jgi:hypothetical protein
MVTPCCRSCFICSLLVLSRTSQIFYVLWFVFDCELSLLILLDHWRITQGLLQWANLFYIPTPANSGFMSRTITFELHPIAWTIDLHLQNSRWHQYFLSFFLMVCCIFLSFSVGMHITCPFEIWHCWKLEFLLWIWLLSGENSGYMMPG